MARCENCDAELQPQWKFCVRCGTKVAVTETAVATVDSRNDPAPVIAPVTAPDIPAAIPAAIRPHEVGDGTEPPTRRRFDWHVLVGILVGVVGAAAIIYLIVALTSGGN